MSHHHEFIFSIYSTPPFITEILIVLLLIVILSFPCTSYLARFVTVPAVVLGEVSPNGTAVETQTLDNLGASAIASNGAERAPHSNAQTSARAAAAQSSALDAAAESSRPTESTTAPEERSTSRKPQGRSYARARRSRPQMEARGPAKKPEVEPVAECQPETELQPELVAELQPEIEHVAEIYPQPNNEPEPVVEILPEHESQPEPIVEFPLEPDAELLSEPQSQPEPVLQPEPAPVVEPENDSIPQPGASHFASDLERREDVQVSDAHDETLYHSAEEPSVYQDARNLVDALFYDAINIAEHQVLYQEAINEVLDQALYEDSIYYTDTQSTYRDASNQVNMDIDPGRENNDENNTPDSPPVHETHFVQVIYYKGKDFPEFSLSETEKSLEKEIVFPFHKYFIEESNISNKISLEPEFHNIFSDTPREQFISRNENHRGKGGSSYRQQETENIDDISATANTFKVQNSNVETTDLMTGPMHISKCNKMEAIKRLKLKEVDKFSRGTCSSPGRNAAQKTWEFIPSSEHSATNDLQKRFLMRDQSHISKFNNSYNTKGNVNFRSLPRMDKRAHLKHSLSTTQEERDADNETSDFYETLLNRSSPFVTKELQDHNKESYGVADCIPADIHWINTSYRSTEESIGCHMIDGSHILTEENTNGGMDTTYCASQPHSEKPQPPTTEVSVENFQINSDVNYVGSTVSENLHKTRIEEAKLFVEFLKKVHYKNIRRKSKLKLQRN